MLFSSGENYFEKHIFRSSNGSLVNLFPFYDAENARKLGTHKNEFETKYEVYSFAIKNKVGVLVEKLTLNIPSYNATPSSYITMDGWYCVGD